MAEESSEERTEQATEKRMKEVRSKGQLSKSQDMTAWVGVGAAALMMPSTIGRGSAAATDHLFTVRAIIDDPDPARAVRALGDGLSSVMTTLGPMLAVVALAVIVAAVAQGGVHPKKFEMKYDQFDPVKGIKRLMGVQALWNGVKVLLKTAVIATVLYAVIQGLMPVLMSAGGLSVSALLAAAGDGVARLLQFAVAAGIALALLDVMVVAKRNRKKTRMSKKEIKDESKRSDGDPLIKSQRRSRQIAMSRNRMIADVADADVVIVNPTHVAVALKYEAGVSAPRVVAKGADHIAAKIREKAEEAGVPMVRDIPLARSLHAACKLGQEVPVELYDSVAKVLVFVMRMKARGGTGGIGQISPAPTSGATAR